MSACTKTTEKDLLQEITYLTRLIKSSGNCTSSNQNNVSHGKSEIFSCHQEKNKPSLCKINNKSYSKLKLSRLKYNKTKPSLIDDNQNSNRYNLESGTVKNIFSTAVPSLAVSVSADSKSHIRQLSSAAISEDLTALPGKGYSKNVLDPKSELQKRVNLTGVEPLSTFYSDIKKRQKLPGNSDEIIYSSMRNINASNSINKIVSSFKEVPESAAISCNSDLKKGEIKDIHQSVGKLKENKLKDYSVTNDDSNIKKPCNNTVYFNPKFSKDKNIIINNLMKHKLDANSIKTTKLSINSCKEESNYQKCLSNKTVYFNPKFNKSIDVMNSSNPIFNHKDVTDLTVEAGHLEKFTYNEKSLDVQNVAKNNVYFNPNFNESKLVVGDSSSNSGLNASVNKNVSVSDNTLMFTACNEKSNNIFVNWNFKNSQSKILVNKNFIQMNYVDKNENHLDNSVSTVSNKDIQTEKKIVRLGKASNCSSSVKLRDSKSSGDCIDRKSVDFDKNKSESDKVRKVSQNAISKVFVNKNVVKFCDGKVVNCNINDKINVQGVPFSKNITCVDLCEVEEPDVKTSESGNKTQQSLLPNNQSSKNFVCTENRNVFNSNLGLSLYEEKSGNEVTKTECNSSNDVNACHKGQSKPLCRISSVLATTNTGTEYLVNKRFQCRLKVEPVTKKKSDYSTKLISVSRTKLISSSEAYRKNTKKINPKNKLVSNIKLMQRKTITVPVALNAEMSNLLLNKTEISKVLPQKLGKINAAPCSPFKNTFQNIQNPYKLNLDADRCKNIYASVRTPSSKVLVNESYCYMPLSKVSKNVMCNKTLPSKVFVNKSLIKHQRNKNLILQNNSTPLKSVKGRCVQKQKNFLNRINQMPPSSFVSISPTKLIRKPNDCKVNHKRIKNDIKSDNELKFSSIKSSDSNLVNKFSVKNIVPAPNKMSSTVRTARSLVTKYKVIRNSNCCKLTDNSGSLQHANKCVVMNPKFIKGYGVGDRFSLRQKSKMSLPNKLSQTHLTARSVVNKYKLIRNVNVNSMSSKKVNPKSSYNCSFKNKINKFMSSKGKVRRYSVTIDGIPFNFTKFKMRRKITAKEGVPSGRTKNKINKIGGETYRINGSGKSLKRVDYGFNKKLWHINANSGCTRFYKRTLSQCLNSYFARSKVVQAKQKSIALLTKKLRKSNEPCLIYNRFGCCSGKEKGTCNRSHDPKCVSICKKFIQGVCENNNCLLSHNVEPSKMPTCHHFLAGVCIRDNCPYLHVKVNSSAPVCIPFLHGYCPDAGKCKKRHIEVCPRYEEKGVCSKGKSCPYPHPKRKKKILKGNLMDTFYPQQGNKKIFIKDNVEIVDKEENINEVMLTNRYYSIHDCSDISDEEGVVEIKRKQDNSSNNDIIGHNWLKKRPRIGDLPCYIPLSDNK